MTLEWARCRVGVTVLLFGTVLAGALAVSLHSGDSIRYPDESDYHQLAQSIMRGGGLVDHEGAPTAFRPPGYPFALSLVYSIWNRPLAGKVFNCLCLLIALLAMYGCVRQSGIPGAWLVPALSLGYPLFPYTSSTLYPQTIAMALLAVSVCLVWNRAISNLRLAAFGILWGLLALLVPAFLLLLPIPAAFAMESGRGGMRKMAQRTCLFLVAAAMVVLPWTARNWVQLGHWVPVSSNSGLNLLLGNSEDTRPNSGVNVDLSGYIKDAERMTEVERDAYFRKAALIWIRQHPIQAGWLYVRKVLNYFNFRNELFVSGESSKWRDVLVAVTYYPLLTVALMRLLFIRKYPLRRGEWLLFLLYFGNAMLGALFFTRIRFRIPFDLLLIGIAAMCVGRMLECAKVFRTSGPMPEKSA